MRQSRMRGPALRIGSWTAAACYTSLGMNHHGSPLASQSLSTCVLHMDSVWLRGLAGPSCVGPTRERDSGPLKRLCIVCIRVGRVYYAFVCVALCMRDVRESVRRAVTKCSRTGYKRAHTTNASTGSRALQLRGCWVSPKCPDEFLSPETRYGCKPHAAVKVLHLAILHGPRAFLEVESSECSPLRYRYILNAYLLVYGRPNHRSGFDFRRKRDLAIGRTR